MRPRPILLVADPLYDSVKLHANAEQVIAEEGYLVLHGPKESFDSFKLLAACPFTPEDVADLRTVSSFLDDEGARDTVALLTSIADRMEGML